MAIPGRPEPAIFFVAILASGRDELRLAAEALTDEFGPADAGSLAMQFAWTQYYQEELGPEPLRAFLAFPGFFFQGNLAKAKLATNALELRLAERIGGPWPRPVNLDPGCMTKSKLILASAKDFSHRIYLADGIFAEITLMYRRGAFHALPWTFPDYASDAYHPFFLSLREKL